MTDLPLRRLLAAALLGIALAMGAPAASAGEGAGGPRGAPQSEGGTTAGAPAALPPSWTAIPATRAPEADALLERREDRGALERAAALYEKADLFTRAARCCYQVLELHGATLTAGEREAWVARGLSDGYRALSVGDEGELLEKLETLDAARAEALLFTAALYGRKIELSWKIKQATMVGTFLRLLERAVTLDGAVRFGGPRRVLGDLLCSAPGFMGGDVERGIRELQAAIDVCPLYLETYVIRAEKVHGGARRDRARFRADLQRVIDAPEGALPAARPENAKAKRAARDLLAREAEIFE